MRYTLFILIMLLAPIEAWANSCKLYEGTYNRNACINQITDAIGKSADHLIKENLEGRNLLAMAYLGRIYAAKELAYFSSYSLKDLQSTQYPYAALRIESVMFSRMIAPDYKAPKAVMRRAKSYDKMTAPALYCDFYPLPQDYSNLLKTELDAGGYRASHVMMALIWVNRYACSINNWSEEDLNEVYKANSAVIDVSDGLNDLEIEIMAFGLVLKGLDFVNQASIDELLLLQSEKGDWRNDHHSSVLATYFLLELRQRLLTSVHPETGGFR